MFRNTWVARRAVEVIDPDGLHMRHATEFVRIAQRYTSDVGVIHEGKPYDGKSILDLMTMAAACGALLELEARGSDADAAVDALAAMLRSQPAASTGSPP
jgi:phosphocarrier protein HPr